MAEEKNPEIKKVVEIINNLSLDEKERELYESREKELMDIRVTNNHAREEGREEGESIGIEKGKAIGKIEDAKAMLKKNMEDETIAEITGLKIEEIKKLRT